MLGVSVIEISDFGVKSELVVGFLDYHFSNRLEDGSYVDTVEQLLGMFPGYLYSVLLLEYFVPVVIWDLGFIDKPEVSVNIEAEGSLVLISDEVWRAIRCATKLTLTRFLILATWIAEADTLASNAISYTLIFRRGHF